MAQGFAKAEFADPGWQDYTPTYTNITVGNGTVVARYIQIGTLVQVQYSLVFGSTTSVDGTGVLLSLPVTSAGTSDGYISQTTPIGVATLRDDGGQKWSGLVYWQSTTAARITAQFITTTRPRQSDMSATVPHTWTTSDSITCTFQYEAAASALIGMGLNNDHGALSGLTDDDHSAYPAYTEYQGSTPTIAGFTIGNGTINISRYTQIGKLVHWYGKVTLGSTSSMSGDLKLSLPVAPNTIYETLDSIVGSCRLQDGSALRHTAEASISGDTDIIIRCQIASGTHLTEAGITSTVPFTWASGDMFAWNVTYEAASAV